MLGRSASGPAGLSINTGGGNLFGSGASTQPPAAGGLFGQTQPAQTGASVFGNTTTTPQLQAAGSLFGANTVAQPQQQTGGLFGGATNTVQAQQTGGLFGSKPAITQPAATGGLFGATTAQPQTQQAGGSLFGGQQPQQAATVPGGLFGGGTAQSQPSQTGGLFGASTANTGSMFGANQSAVGRTGLFGMGATNPLQHTQQHQQQHPQVAGLTMGQSAVKQQVIPGVRIDLSNIRSTTRFNDLQEDLQRELANIDEKIQSCIRDCEAVEAFLPEHGEQLSAIPTDVNFVTRKSEGAHRALESDVEAISQLRELINRDADNARLSFKAIDNLKLPMQYHQAGLWSKSSVSAGVSADANAESNSDLISFFSKTADEMDEMMKKFERNLGEIEVHLHGVQGNMMEQLQRAAAQSSNASQVGVNERAIELAGVLRDFEEGILKVAGVVGGVKEGITELQLKDLMGHGS